MNGSAHCHTPARRAIASLLCGLLAAPPALLSAPALAAAPQPKAAQPSPGAATGPRLAVLAFSLDDNPVVAERIGQLAETVVVRGGRQRLASLSVLLDPSGAAAREAKRAEGRAEYESARRFYEELEVQKAADHCDRSLAAFERSDLSSHFDELVKSWMFRIAALIANAENRTASVELNLLLPLDMQTPFDPAVFAPDFIAQARKRREELQAKANLGFDLQSRPAPARVFVDGRFLGVTPLEVRGLPPGDHYVTLTSPGYQLVQKRFRAGVGQTYLETMAPAEQLPMLEAAKAELRRDFRGPGRNAAGRQLAQRLGVDELLVIGVAGRDKDSLQVLAVRLSAQDGHELSYVDEPLPVDEARFGPAAEDLLGRVVLSDLARKGGRASSTTGGGFAWRPRHTGYLLTGLGLVAAGVAVYFATDANDAEKQYRIREDAQPNPVYAELEKQGKRSALWADLSYGAALILGGTGGFMAITDIGLGGRDEENPGIDEKRTVRGTALGTRPPEESRPGGAPSGPAAAPKKTEVPPEPKKIEAPIEPKKAEAPPEPKKIEAPIEPKKIEPPPEPRKYQKPARQKPKKEYREEDYHDDLRDD